jgi:hypothetical protein
VTAMGSLRGHLSPVAAGTAEPYVRPSMPCCGRGVSIYHLTMITLFVLQFLKSGKSLASPEHSAGPSSCQWTNLSGIVPFIVRPQRASPFRLQLEALPPVSGHNVPSPPCASPTSSSGTHRRTSSVSEDSSMWSLLSSGPRALSQQSLEWSYKGLCNASRSLLSSGQRNRM